MIAVVQRVTEASVVVEGSTVGRIGAGLLALVAVHATDSAADAAWMANKLATLRIFRGNDRHFDQDVRQVNGSILLVSNFTVAGKTQKGRRPSLDAAAGLEVGQMRFDELVQAVRGMGVATETGVFGADMKVSLTNDGPVTFVVDSRKVREEQ